MERKVIEGTICGNYRGYAFLISDYKEDYFISHSDLRGALHSDTVLAEIKPSGDGRTTARVLKVLKRGVEKLTGTYFSKRVGGYVVPDDNKYFCDITVPAGVSGLYAKSGDKVAVKITSYPKGKNPEGIIVKVFGRQFEREAELKSIFYSYKIPQKFPKDVIWEADKLPNFVSKSELEDRKDLRNKITFTIDGENSRDFDDAISIEKLQNGNYLLGVHIADVSHYVKENGKIDEEAFLRASSIYFPEHVFPMLPEKLCCNICSLLEGEDRLTLSAIMEINGEGEVKNLEILPSVINSCARTTYNGIQEILDGKKPCGVYQKIEKEIFLASNLADILIKRREKEGVIDLESLESEITVKGKEIIVKPAKSDKAHRIIEEFMILANVAVAEYLYYSDIPCVYRTHAKPEAEKLANFYSFLDALGVSYKRRKDEVFSKDFQAILNSCKESSLYPLVNRIMLRSMQKARYKPECEGHFGLSLKCYCHFTSPIRRYPDLMVHRILKEFIKKGEVKFDYKQLTERVSVHASDRERHILDAERQVDEYYKLLYVSENIGEEYQGVISGVTGFGFFVELESSVEGLVKIETLRGRKKFEFNSKSYSLSNGKKIFRLGDTVKIKVAGINIATKKAEFVLVDD